MPKVPSKKTSSATSKSPKTPKTPNKAKATSKTPTRPDRPHKKTSKKKANKENEVPSSPLPSAKVGPLIDVPSSDGPTPSPTDSAAEVRRLKEELVQARAEKAEALAAQKAAEEAAKQAKASKRAEIQPIARPPGEAGSGKKGFPLKKTMGLKDDPALYRKMRSNLRTEVKAVQLDLSLPWAQQDVTKLSNIYSRMRHLFPYLTTKRFPGNWATADMIKTYARGLRKRAKLEASGNADDDETDDETDEDDTEDEEGGDEEEGDGDEEDDDSESEEEPEKAVRPLKKRRLADNE